MLAVIEKDRCIGGFGDFQQGRDPPTRGEPASGTTDWLASSAPIVGRSGLVMDAMAPASGWSRPRWKQAAPSDHRR
jgi:hypothetical protein